MTNKTKTLKKIVVVDDEEDILDIIRFALEDMSGVEVRAFNSGQELIQESLAFKPDLILLDVMMPEMSGQTILKAIRLFPPIAKTPIIFITARIQKEEIQEYLQLGAIGVIQKPFNPLTLAHDIQRHWDRYQQSKG